MDQIYKIGGHCFALPDERLMEVVDGISGFKPFIWQPDLVLVKDVYEGAWLPDFTVWEGNGWDFPAFQRKSYGFGYEDVTGTFGVSGDSFLLELAPQGEPSLYLRTMGETGKGICLYGHYSPRLLRFALWMGYGLMTVRKDTVALHGSCIVYKGKAVLFLGESGTGKSTHTRLWRENIAGSKLLNDDSPIVRYEEGACGYMAARGVGRLLVIRRNVIRWPDVYVCHKHRIIRYGD
mgnify:FL=1